MIKKYGILFWTASFFLILLAVGGCGGGSSSSFVMAGGSKIEGKIMAWNPVASADVVLKAGDVTLASAAFPSSAGGRFEIDMSGVEIPAQRYGLLECSGGYAASGDAFEKIGHKLTAVVDFQTMRKKMRVPASVSYLTTIVDINKARNGGDYEKSLAEIVRVLSLSSGAGIESGNLASIRTFSPKFFKSALEKNNVDGDDAFRDFVLKEVEKSVNTSSPLNYRAGRGANWTDDPIANDVMDWELCYTVCAMIDALAPIFQSARGFVIGPGFVYTWMNRAVVLTENILATILLKPEIEKYMTQIADFSSEIAMMSEYIRTLAIDMEENCVKIASEIDDLEEMLDVYILSSDLECIKDDLGRIASADMEFVALLSDDVLPEYTKMLNAYQVSCDQGVASADAAAYASGLLSEEVRKKAGDFLSRVDTAAGYDMDQSLSNIHDAVMGDGLGRRGLLESAAKALAEEMVSDRAKRRPYDYYAAYELFYLNLVLVQEQGALMELNYINSINNMNGAKRSAEGASVMSFIGSPERFKEEFRERMAKQSAEFLRGAMILTAHTAVLESSTVLYDTGGSGWEEAYAPLCPVSEMDPDAVELCAGSGPDPGESDYYQKYVGFLDRAYFYASMAGGYRQFPLGAAFVYFSTIDKVNEMVKKAEEGKLVLSSYQNERKLSPVVFGNGGKITKIRTSRQFVDWKSDGKNLTGVFSDTLFAAVFATFPTEEEDAAAEKDKESYVRAACGQYVELGISNELKLDGKSVYGCRYYPKTDVMLDGNPLVYNFYARSADYFLYKDGYRETSEAMPYVFDLTAKIDIGAAPDDITAYFEPTNGSLGNSISSLIDADYSGGAFSARGTTFPEIGCRQDVQRGSQVAAVVDKPIYSQLNAIVTNSRIKFTAAPQSGVDLSGGLVLYYDHDHSIFCNDSLANGRDIQLTLRSGTALRKDVDNEDDISYGWLYNCNLAFSGMIGIPSFSEYDLEGYSDSRGWSLINAAYPVMPALTSRLSGDGLLDCVNGDRGGFTEEIDIFYKYLAVKPYLEK